DRRLFMMTGATLVWGCCGANTRGAQDVSSASPSPSSTDSSGDAQASAAERTTASDEAPVISWQGRVQADGPTSARYAWSGCGFRTRFFGTGLIARFSDEENL